MHHPAFPKSFAVSSTRARDPVCQFSFVCDGSLYRRPRPGMESGIVANGAGWLLERAVGAATLIADYIAPIGRPGWQRFRKSARIFLPLAGAWGSTAAFSGRYIAEPDDPRHFGLRCARQSDRQPCPVDDPAMAGPPIPRRTMSAGCSIRQRLDNIPMAEAIRQPRRFQTTDPGARTASR
jgi:hypothetical protein